MVHNLAILLTCFNRKEKTLKCLHSLFSSLAYYNDRNNNESIEADVFLTDDGSTDGTADAIRGTFQEKSIHIIKGNGSLYWAGGMRTAWKEAIKVDTQWDYYLLLNDDVILQEDAFDELIKTRDYCVEKYKKEGLYSGIICDPDDRGQITYGGDVFVNKFTGLRRRLGVSEVPQMCDLTNANILLVPKTVVKTIGILYEGYCHAAADFDYSYMARKAGFPVLITAKPCGICKRDHKTTADVQEMFAKMTLGERKKYLANPLHSNADYELLIKRTTPLKYPITWFFRKLHLYTPDLYYRLNGKR